MTTDQVFVFELEIPIRWGDMDAMGHVNNTVYFRYMEQARISWFDAIGLPPSPDGQGPVIVNAACTFVRQLEYPGTVLCRHYVGRIGTSSFDTTVTMSRTDQPDVVYAECSARCVWVDYPRRKSAPLPPAVRERLRVPVGRAAAGGASPGAAA